MDNKELEEDGTGTGAMASGTTTADVDVTPGVTKELQRRKYGKKILPPGYVPPQIVDPLK
jgi:hypothetical protein